MGSNKLAIKFQKEEYILINPMQFFSIYYAYDFDDSFAFYTVDYGKREIKQVTSLTPCRETLAGQVKFQVYMKKVRCCNGVESKPIKKSTPKKDLIRLDRTQLLLKKKISKKLQDKYFYTGINSSNMSKRMSNALADPINNSKEYEESLLKRIKILNILEHECGWLKTKACKVVYNKELPQELYMIVGSRRWIAAPSLLSLYVMLLRSGHRLVTENFYSYQGLMKSLDKKLKPLCKNSKGWDEDTDNGWSDHDDKFYAAMTYKYWALLLRNYKNLFESISIYDAYKVRKSEDYQREPDKDGIYNLCNPNYTYSHKKLKERFMKLVKKVGK